MTKTVDAAKAAYAPLDLATLDTEVASDKGARIEILHPVAGSVGVFITLLGKHSQVFRDIVRDRINRKVREKANADRRGKAAELPTAEANEAEAIELLVACTLGWDTEVRDSKGEIIEAKPTLFFGGEELAFSVPNAFKVYKTIWVREGVDEAIGDLENFMQA